MRASKSGTVLGATLVVVLAITVVLAGLLKWTNTESKISRHNLLQIKAQYGAEASAEYALAQMRCVLQQKPVYISTLFTPASTPPTTASTAVLGSTQTSILASVAGSGRLGYATDIIGSLSSLQSSATSPTERFSVGNTVVRVGSFTTEQPLHVDPTNKLYEDDPLRGQNVRVREVKVLAAATATDTVRGESKTAYVEETLQVRDSPLVGYAMFYNVLMEIAPGVEMDVYGPVHANRDIYAQSAVGLNFHGVVTTAGKLHHGRAPGADLSVVDGTVKFPNADGSLVDMNQSGTWIDSSHSDWTTHSSALWNGNVLTGTAGVNPTMPANIPTYIPDDPLTTGTNELVNEAHMLVEPAIKTNSTSYPGDDIEVQKFVSQASLVLTVSSTGTIQAYKLTAHTGGEYLRKTSSGIQYVNRTELNVPTDLIVGGIASEKFLDARRAKSINVVDLDVSKLRTLIEDDSEAADWTKDGISFDPATEWNGIVYIESADTTRGSVRLVNGARLPNRPTSANNLAKGFTLATNVPVYIQGNYNADGTIPSDPADIRNYETDEVPAAIAADAITILSNAWTDANSNSGLSSRVATTTEVSAAVISGVVPTGNGTYSGGVENLPRFLEDWSGVTIGYRGSLIALFESTLATEPWGSSNIYSPPRRVWGYSKMFEENIKPPGAHGTRTFRRIGFRHLSASEYQAAVAQL